MTFDPKPSTTVPTSFPHEKIAYLVDGVMFLGTLDDYASAWANERYGSDIQVSKTVMGVVDGKFKELEVSSEHLYTSGQEWMYYSLHLRDPETKIQFDFVEVRIDGRV